jgi:hypothetical protein
MHGRLRVCVVSHAAANEIGPSGCSALAQALPHLSALQQLNLICDLILFYLVLCDCIVRFGLCGWCGLMRGRLRVCGFTRCRERNRRLRMLCAGTGSAAPDGASRAES